LTWVKENGVLIKGIGLIKDNEFFIGLPQGKVKGFCEPPESDIDNSVVVDVEKDCIPAKPTNATCLTQ
jgi:hypothetical protein